MDGVFAILAIAYLAERMLEAVMDRYVAHKNEKTEISSMEIES